MKHETTETVANVQEDQLLELVIEALEDLKGDAIRILDVRGLTSITDRMVIASGTSTRHVKSLADNVIRRTKEAGFRALGVEGEQAAEWVLVDLGDVVVHVMMPRIREFYALEKLWSVGSERRPAS
jgi:ribosome-associated protein